MKLGLHGGHPSLDEKLAHAPRDFGTHFISAPPILVGYPGLWFVTFDPSFRLTRE